MFERYTEKARRVIFFARYEASQYGSSYIETEHLLLGLLREDPALLSRFQGPTSVAPDIRAEIERQITRRERISTSVEVPLSAECKRILNMAAEEAERLGHKRVGTEHLLLGIVREEKCFGAKILMESAPWLSTVRERGLRPQAIREHLARALGSVSIKPPADPTRGAIATLDSFLAGLQVYNWDYLAPFFARNTQFVDSTGKRWIGLEEIEKRFEMLFAPYAKRNATFVLEGTYLGPAESVVASVLWENVTFGGKTTKSMQRMTVILVQEGEDWVIFLVQATPVVAN